MLKNTKIKIRYINLTPLEGNSKLIFPLIKNYLGLPRPHNVIVPSIVVGLNCNYSKIYLSGAIVKYIVIHLYQNGLLSY